MAVSRLLPSGGANDFNLNITGPTTSVTFDKEYAGGSYSITSSAVDITLDFYAYNSAGTLVGYTSTKAFTASGGFNKIVILGGTNGDVIGFTFKKTFTTTDTSSEVTAGPVALSNTPSSLPSVGGTTVITGKNFATNATVTFSSANTAFVSTSATVVRNSATQLTVTRPAVMPTTYSPYTMTVENPGVTNPIGSNSHILSNSITAGVNPAWGAQTNAAFFVTSQAGYTYQLSASDADGSVTYSQVSGTLPAGLSLNASTGAITGTPTATVSSTATFRATDAGGNFVDKAITFPILTWTQSLSFAGTASVQLAPTVTTEAALTYSIATGALPSGLSVSSSGLITGTVGSTTTGSVTFTVIDSRGGTKTQAFAWSTRTQAAGTTFTYNSLPSFFLPTDIISGFPAGSTTAFSTFTGATSVSIRCAGAGGGRAVAGSGTPGNGGTGGLSIGTFAVSNLNSPLQISIGGGGTASGGGNMGSGGGGYTGAARNDGTWLIMAGAGGGGGGVEGSNGGAGGAGGGANQSGNSGNSGSGTGGSGGTTSAGGSGGGGSYGSGTAGGSLSGGRGGSDNASGSNGGTFGGGRGGYGYGGGGGGGAGWFGGGGGGAQSSSGGGGGGGSGYLNTTYGTLVTATVGGGNAGGQTDGATGSAGSVTITIVS